jgi:hypothetical protein
LQSAAAAARQRFNCDRATFESQAYQLLIVAGTPLASRSAGLADDMVKLGFGVAAAKPQGFL